jgi:hypothetical protein
MPRGLNEPPREIDMSSRSESGGSKPEYVASLEAAYGAPSQAGFGSAVFRAEMGPADERRKTWEPQSASCYLWRSA